jgi:hypothetical protein
MEITMRKINVKIVILLFLCTSIGLIAENNPLKKTFTKSDIEKIADAYVNNDVHAKNPAIVYVDGDGKFDLLVFDKGNVAYYRNTGTLEQPHFELVNDHYDKYEIPKMLPVGLPYPIFFADKDGKGKVDMFAVTKLDYNPQTQKYDYRILHAENALGLDTGTLITIILVLVIVLLVLAIIH